MHQSLLYYFLSQTEAKLCNNIFHLSKCIRAGVETLQAIYFYLLANDERIERDKQNNLLLASVIIMLLLRQEKKFLKFTKKLLKDSGS